MPSYPYGTAPNGYGTVPYGGSGAFLTSNPTCTVTSPTAGQVIGSGGPNLAVTWSYGQADGFPQLGFQVVVQNAGGSTTYLNTGFQSGSATSYNINCVTAGIPTDTTGSALKVIVTVYAVSGTLFSGSGNQLFDIQWGVVTTTVTTPAGPTVSGATTMQNVAWTFASTRGFPQAQYQIIVKNPDTGSVYYTGLLTSGTASSATINLQVVSNQRYQFIVTAFNSQGVGNAGSVVVTGSSYDPSLLTPNPDVGRTWHVGINGLGFMLQEDPTVPHWYKQIYLRQSQQIDAGASYRIATGSTPFNEAVARYVFTGFADWRTGAGQTFLDRDDSVPNRYFNSENVNPFNKYQLTLLPAQARIFASANTPQRGVVVNNVLYVQTGAKQITAISTWGGATTAFNIAAATTINDLTSDGQFWYASTNNGVYRNSTAADPGGAWSTIGAATNYNAISWAGQRICLTYTTATNTIWTTLNSSGVEEVAGGRVTNLSSAWTIGKATGASSGHLWFPAFSGTEGNVVYAWDLVNTDAPTVALALLGGEIPRRVYFYEGNLMLKVDFGTQGVLYRCTSDATGNLTPTFVTDTISTGSEVDFLGNGRRVFFSWSKMDTAGDSGIGALDITTGGYTKWQTWASGGNAAIRSIFFWQGAVGFTYDGQGPAVESSVTGGSLVYPTSGFVQTSISDKATNVTKSWDVLQMNTLPLPSATSVAVSFSIDNSLTFTSISGATMNAANQTTVSAPFTAISQSISLKITLTSTTSTNIATPTLLLAQLRAHHINLGDTTVNLPIDAHDYIVDVKGKAAPFNGPGVGMQRVKMLEGWIGQRVLFQDIDYADTGVSEVWEVHDIEVRSSVNQFNPHRDRMEGGGIAIVTLIKRNL